MTDVTENWWERFPGSAPSSAVRVRAGNTIEMIQNGNVDGAREQLRRGWDDHLDTTGVPGDIRARFRELELEALSALGSTRNDPNAAIEALNRMADLSVGREP